MTGSLIIYEVPLYTQVFALPSGFRAPQIHTPQIPGSDVFPDGSSQLPDCLLPPPANP